jgi:hypothetical protein
MDRALYLQADMRAPSQGLSRAQRLLTLLGDAAVAAAHPPFAIAAE